MIRTFGRNLPIVLMVSLIVLLNFTELSILGSVFVLFFVATPVSVAMALYFNLYGNTFYEYVGKSVVYGAGMSFIMTGVLLVIALTNSAESVDFLTLLSLLAFWIILTLLSGTSVYGSYAMNLTKRKEYIDTEAQSTSKDEFIETGHGQVNMDLLERIMSDKQISDQSQNPR